MLYIDQHPLNPSKKLSVLVFLVPTKLPHVLVKLVPVQIAQRLDHDQHQLILLNFGSFYANRKNHSKKYE